ncbi:helix-turn-helix domain-containing protein [Yinghuangia sp. ASG 101]|uniref:helix-turn-helix domain-containing protein n=1 Tax=Yinghuangia sp. ASG 101 TaxID=2896848 RepID=UPI001E32F5DA|nr:helix-turn-helix transcriptional regulator [Yinghuangia sp. ASG 101]UGQ12287.1 helix-turn-helix domain-containing protein [Yinghuangia sp. ASG 101]
MGTSEAEYRMPEWLLGREETIEACAARDIGAIFRLARRHTGCFNSKLARLCGLTPSRVGEYISGRSRAQQQQVIERVADGLGIPGHMLGLAPRPWESSATPAVPAPMRPAGVPRATADTPSANAFAEGAAVAPGDVIELSTEVALDISETGAARLMYRHVLLNLGDRPLASLARQVWFERTSGRIVLAAVRPPDPATAPAHVVTMRRVHETGSFLKFACLITPPLAPRESMVVQYLCTGGLFVDEHYWRQDIIRPTRHLQITVRQLGVAELRGCDVVAERGDGREEPSTSGLTWSHREDGTVFVTYSGADLTAPQALTLRWDVAPARSGG